MVRPSGYAFPDRCVAFVQYPDFRGHCGALALWQVVGIHVSQSGICVIGTLAVSFFDRGGWGIVGSYFD